MTGNMTDVRCWQCNEVITRAIVSKWGSFRIGVRDDKHFCNGTCTAAYHREHEQPNIHAKLERHIHFDCDVCGQIVKINEYADRAGQRRAKYCSARCKQQAYRERIKSMKEAAKAEQGKKVRNAAVWQCKTPDCGQMRFTEPIGAKCDYCGGTDWGFSRSF